MVHIPNPARFVTVSEALLKKRGLFISDKKIKQIRSYSENSFTKLMFSNVKELTDEWLREKTDFSQLPNISRAHFHGFLEASFQAKLFPDKNLEKQISIKTDALLSAISKTGKNALDLFQSLYTLSLLYHWNTSFLTKTQKHQIEKAVHEQATYLYSVTKAPLGYWGGTPLHNISHCAWCGIGIAGFAFSSILPEAKYWLNDAFHYFNVVSWLQAEYGTLIEGGSYSAYETEMRAHFYYLSKDLLQEDLYRPSHKGIADYFVQLHKPDGDRNNHIFPWGDSSRGLLYHSPNNLLLSLASAFQSSELQSKAYWILKKGFTKKAGCEWMNLIYYDAKVPYQENCSLKTEHYFPDLGMIVSRSSWQKEASALSFKCGPYQGFRARKDFDGDPGGSHCHADSGSLQFYAKGTDILIDPGYETLKRTQNHNTLMVNGFGQLGEGSKWFGVNHALHYGQRGDILYYKSDKKFACWIADATKCYVPEAKIKQYLRSVIFIKPNILLVFDEIETQGKSTFQIFWHTPLLKVSGNNKTVLFSNEKANLQLNVLSQKNKLKIKSKKQLYHELVIPTTNTFTTLTNTQKTNHFVCLSAFVVGKANDTQNVKVLFEKNNIKIEYEKKMYKVKIVKEPKYKIIATSQRI